MNPEQCLLSDLSRSHCLEVVGLAFAPGLLDLKALGCRTHFQTLKAAGKRWGGGQ